MNLTADKVLDAKGLACPMPIVRTKIDYFVFQQYEAAQKAAF